MPATSEINEVPPVPDWVHWNEEQTNDYASEYCATCDCCGDVRFIRPMRASELPDFIAGDPALAVTRWVTTLVHRSSYTGDVLLRYSMLDSDYYQQLYTRDATFSALDEYYDYICESCHDSRTEANSEAEEEQSENHSSLIHSYGHRPRTVFHTLSNGDIMTSYYPALSELGRRGVVTPASEGGGRRVEVPMCGFELEMTRESSRLTVHDAASIVHEACGSFSYMKEDGSIGNGFELVTHPHTLEAYKAQTPLWDTLNTLRQRGWRSWSSSDSCGLHIHINNSSFKDVAHAMRFIMFVYKNREPLIRFAGRDSRYARFDFDQFVQREVHVGWKDDGSPRYEIQTVADVVKKKQVNDNRYLALNAQNTHTYELRFFRGNLNPDAVRACLEFTFALHEYTQDLTSHDCLVNRALTWRPFLAYVRRKSGDENFRYRFLHQRLTMATRNGDNGFLNTGGAE